MPAVTIATQGPGANVDPSATRVDNEENDEPKIDADTQFLFDAVARQNTGIVQNIDAVDGDIIAVAVGIIASGLFIGDKWFELGPLCRCSGLFLLGETTRIVIGGYLTIHYLGAGAEDPGRLTDFAVDFTSAPQGEAP